MNAFSIRARRAALASLPPLPLTWRPHSAHDGKPSQGKWTAKTIARVAHADIPKIAPALRVLTLAKRKTG